MSDALSETQKRLFDIAAAVEYLRSIGAGAASSWFVRQLIASGEIPHIRIGKKFYISREALDGWLAKHERRSK